MINSRSPLEPGIALFNEISIHFDTFNSSGKHVRAMNTPLKPHFYSKTGVSRGIPNILNFEPKYTLWVLVRTASARRY